MEAMLDKARIAQRVLEQYNQEQVDALVKVIAKVVFDNAEELARLAVEETGMGRVDHKIRKNQGKSRVLWWALKGKKSVGIINRVEAEGIVEVAKPMGVIGAVTPTTNPVVTPMCNAMFAIKGRNTIIISPHPRSKKTSSLTVSLINDALANVGAPEHLIQCIEEPSTEISGLVMKMTDVCISTGGMGMVRAAYSSGKPAFGVGAGNVQCIIDRDANPAVAVPMIIEGREFDNGIICSCEQSVICPEEKVEGIVEVFTANGAAYIDKPDEVARIRETLFPGGLMNKDCIGRPAFEVAKLAGISVPENARILLIKADDYGDNDLLSKEKMCPAISLYPYKSWEHAVDIAEANLEVEGKGHSVCIHSENQANIEYASNRLPVSRFLINQICATANGGSFFNGLAATTTLGCGSWGGNSISENLSYRHLFNVSRIAYIKPEAYEPSDDEIWR